MQPPLEQYLEHPFGLEHIDLVIGFIVAKILFFSAFNSLLCKSIFGTISFRIFSNPLLKAMDAAILFSILSAC